VGVGAGAEQEAPLPKGHEWSLPLQSASCRWRLEIMDGSLAIVAAKQMEFCLSGLSILVGLSLTVQPPPSAQIGILVLEFFTEDRLRPSIFELAHLVSQLSFLSQIHSCVDVVLYVTKMSILPLAHLCQTCICLF
jgi:hypothetical protein